MSRRWASGLAVLTALALLAMLANAALGERSQRGNLVVSLDGELAPLHLPRDRPAPIAVHLTGGLATADGAALPRVAEIQLGLPAQGVVDTRGLPTCGLRRLRDASRARARSLCGAALVGHGELRAEVHLPNQAPFQLDGALLAFNGRDRAGRRAVLVHTVAARPPAVIVLPFVFTEGEGRFGTFLEADLPRDLGPLPRVSSFDLTLSRRFSSHGMRRSFLSASCPLPPSLTAGFFSFARVRFTLADGSQVGTGIARSCRARG